MNPSALLALISELYETVQLLQQRLDAANKKLADHPEQTADEKAETSDPLS